CLIIASGSVHASHSCSVIAIASLSLARTDFAAGNRTPACPARSREREWIAMTRRRVLCGLLLLSAVLACFAGWLWIVSGPRVRRAKFEQVKKGMTREEVIGIVGGPPGDYRTGEVELDQEPDEEFENLMFNGKVLLGKMRPRIEWWQGDDGTFWICF